MDHVQTPLNSTHPPIVVPYLCTEDYPGVPFQVYAAYKKWSLADIFFRAQWTREAPFGDDMICGRHSLEEATSFLQNWLFFGLLTSILGLPINAQDFTRNDVNGRRIMTTAKLPQYIKALEERDQDLIEIQVEHRRKTTEEVITAAHKVFNYVSEGTSIDPALMLSIGALGDYLTMIRNSLYCRVKPDKYLYLEWSGRARNKGLGGDFLAEKMLQDGWCESQVRRALRLSPSGRYFASRLVRPDLGRSHEECGLAQCKAYQMNWVTYKTAHVRQACDCSFIHAESNRLFAILRAGRIPVISTSSSFREGIPLEILEAEPGDKYVAISHVWSDGLGNSYVNSLPQCQLHRISRLVRELYEVDVQDVSFWIDTICCPREPLEARRLAINVMHKTYNGAEKVLVLDKYLQSAPAQPMSDVECMIRIYFSGWLTRMWTLQEGILSRMLYIQFADIAVDLTKALVVIGGHKHKQAEFHKLVQYLIIVRGAWVWLRTKEPFPALQTFAEALYDRSTSVPTDEALCLGIVTETDMDVLTNVPPGQRMKQFWSLRPTYTGDLIFWTGRRLDDKGYRWAPASFMNQPLAIFPGNFETNKASPAQRTNSGLLVKYPGVVIGALGSSGLAPKFWVRDHNLDWRYWMECTANMNGSDDSKGVIMSRSEDHLVTRDLAIILRLPIQRLEDDAHQVRAIEAAVVSIYERVNSVVYATLQATGNLFLAVPGFMPKGDSLEQAFYIKKELLAIQARQGASIERGRINDVILEDLHYAFDGDWLDENQEWCID